MTYIIWHVHTISIHPPTLLTLDVGLKTNEITLPGGWIRLLATLPLLFSLGIPCYKHLHKLTSTKSCIHYWANAATNNILVSRHIIERTLKGLSHWRRRRRDCRDWSVAATRATRETKKWLALSPRRRRRDCRDWSVTATRETKLWLALSRRGDVSETCWRLKNRTCLNFPRLPGDPASLQETSRRRLRNQRRLESPPSLQASEMHNLA